MQAVTAQTTSSQTIFSIDTTACFESCTQNEADTRILLHVKATACSGHENLKTRAVDIDMIILAVSLFNGLDIESLWISFNSRGKARIWTTCTVYDDLADAMAQFSDPETCTKEAVHNAMPIIEQSTFLTYC